MKTKNKIRYQKKWKWKLKLENEMLMKQPFSFLVLLVNQASMVQWSQFQLLINPCSFMKVVPMDVQIWDSFIKYSILSRSHTQPSSRGRLLGCFQLFCVLWCHITLQPCIKRIHHWRDTKRNKSQPWHWGLIARRTERILNPRRVNGQLE